MAHRRERTRRTQRRHHRAGRAAGLNSGRTQERRQLAVAQPRRPRRHRPRALGTRGQRLAQGPAPACRPLECRPAGRRRHRQCKPRHRGPAGRARPGRGRIARQPAGWFAGAGPCRARWPHAGMECRRRHACCRQPHFAERPAGAERRRRPLAGRCRCPGACRLAATVAPAPDDRGNAGHTHGQRGARRQGCRPLAGPRALAGGRQQWHAASRCAAGGPPACRPPAIKVAGRARRERRAGVAIRWRAGRLRYRACQHPANARRWQSGHAPRHAGRDEPPAPPSMDRRPARRRAKRQPTAVAPGRAMVARRPGAAGGTLARSVDRARRPRPGRPVLGQFTLAAGARVARPGAG